MQPELQAHFAFHMIGKRPGGEPDAADEIDLRPALLAEYRDLSALRYDFPLVLMRNTEGQASVQSLSGLIEDALKGIAGTADDKRLRQHAMRLEREVRKLVVEGASQSLSDLLDIVTSRLAAQKDELLGDSLKRIRAALKGEGQIVDCDKAMPFRLVQHVWKTVHDGKARAFRNELNALIMKLSDILRADFVSSEEGLSAERLEASVGATHREAFDFAVMSRMLSERSANASLADTRRRRIRWLLSVLKAQRFYAPDSVSDKRFGAAEPYGFFFDNCAEAVAAYRERLPKMIEVAKAIAIAKLEIEGSYNESRHDGFFEDFGVNGLDPDDVARFPDCLIWVHAEAKETCDNELILRALAAGLPAKVLIQTDDLVEQSPLGDGPLVFGLRSKQLVSTAISLGTFYVLQSTSSNLFQLRDRIFAAMGYAGPALFSVFSGATGHATGLPPYLTAAAAMDARAFPALIYDPAAGPDWASRFSLKGNPQPDRDWPVQSLAYEDDAHQRQCENLAFTLVDFAACDRRFARHFAKIPRAKWTEDMVSVSEFATSQRDGTFTKVPCLLMVDRENQLQKLIVDDKMSREARRCIEMWRSLQELGGIHNSHAARLLEKERKIWAEELHRETESRETQPGAAAGVPAAPAIAPTQIETTAEKPSDDPYIETSRCTSCNECTQINDKMFGYDANKQASIVNPDAGTYRQLVEAAESCQVSIIHPGKPRDPNEPGLEELLVRAEPFR
ncbi:MAG: ferredoxin [Beijerinckiaceae bacterium]